MLGEQVPFGPKTQGSTNGKTTMRTGGNEHKGVNLSNDIDILKHKPTRATNKILEGHVPSKTTPPPPGMAKGSNKVSPNDNKGDGRVLPRMLLNDGQGKSTSVMDISSSSKSEIVQHTSDRTGTAPKKSITMHHQRGQAHIATPTNHQGHRADCNKGDNTKTA